MATRPHKIQKVTDRDILSSPPATLPAAAAQPFSKDLENVVTGQELWQQQRTKWVGNSTGSSRSASRPVISPDSTYDTLLLTTRPFAIQIPLAVVFGGAGAQGPLGDLWLFDLASKQWSQPDTKGEPPAAREMHTGTMIDETRMLIYGGRGPDGKVLCDACLFDAGNLTWKLKEPTPFARCAHTAVALPSEAGCSGNQQSDTDEPMGNTTVMLNNSCNVPSLTAASCIHKHPIS